MHVEGDVWCLRNSTLSVFTRTCQAFEKHAALYDIKRFKNKALIKNDLMIPLNSDIMTTP